MGIQIFVQNRVFPQQMVLSTEIVSFSATNDQSVWQPLYWSLELWLRDSQFLEPEEFDK